MPAVSFVMGAEDWTPVDHKSDDGDRGARRMLPVGDIHALDPEHAKAQCTGEAMAPEPGRRSFTPWAAGSCAACSEALSPRAPDVAH